MSIIADICNSPDDGGWYFTGYVWEKNAVQKELGGDDKIYDTEAECREAAKKHFSISDAHTMTVN